MRLTEKEYNERLQAALALSQDISPGESGHIDAHKALVDYIQLHPRIPAGAFHKIEADTWRYIEGGETATMTDSDIDEMLDYPDGPGTLFLYGNGGDLFPTSAASCPVGSRILEYARGSIALSLIAEVMGGITPLFEKVYSLEQTINQLQSDVEALKNPE